MITKNINFGCKVKIIFNKLSKIKGKNETLRNVTEIHYDYPSDLKAVVGKQIAFESDIHQTGLSFN